MSPEIDDKRPAVFRLDRMRMVEVLLDQSFIESPWSPEELRDNIEQDWHAANPREQYKIKLRITGPQALDVMETEFFKGEKKRLDSKGKNGAVLYEVTLKGLERITLWIMRSLECFEIIEPKELRDEIDRRVNEYLKHRKVMKG
jgi:predicted DNA-binding transcriptional regulator YafY